MSTICSACHEENFLLPQPCDVLFWEALEDFPHGDVDPKPQGFASKKQFPTRRSNFNMCKKIFGKNLPCAKTTVVASARIMLKKHTCLFSWMLEPVSKSYVETYHNISGFLISLGSLGHFRAQFWINFLHPSSSAITTSAWARRFSSSSRPSWKLVSSQNFSRDEYTPEI